MLKTCLGPQMPRICMLVRVWKKNPSSTTKCRDTLTILETSKSQLMGCLENILRKYLQLILYQLLLDANSWAKLPFDINKFTHHYKKVSKITFDITGQLLSLSGQCSKAPTTISQTNIQVHSPLFI